jgi:RNA polymerase sigma-70 factor (ECF subfamily)
MTIDASPRPPVAILDGLTDEALALRAQAGSVDAFGVLVERYEGRLVGFLTRRVGSRHDAEDAAQDAVLRAWKHLGRFDPSQRFGVWLFTIAAREAVSAWRKRDAGARAEAVRRARDTSTGRGMHDGFERDDAPAGVWDLAERLFDAETMSALWLRYAGGLEPGEIARVLGRSTVGVRVLLHRARKRLAGALERSPTMNDGPRAFRGREIDP